MSIIKKENIVAIRRGDGTVVCMKHADQEDWKDITEEDVITEDMILKGDYVYFCDEGKEEISF